MDVEPTPGIASISRCKANRCTKQSADRQRGTGHERGTAMVVVALAGAMVVLATLLLSGLTHRVVDRSKAQAAADAAALAGVTDGRQAAAALAAANDAVLLRFDDRGNEVTVEVVTDAGTEAVASAERRLAAFEGG